MKRLGLFAGLLCILIACRDDENLPTLPQRSQISVKTSTLQGTNEYSMTEYFYFVDGKIVDCVSSNETTIVMEKENQLHIIGNSSAATYTLNTLGYATGYKKDEHDDAFSCGYSISYIEINGNMFLQEIIKMYGMDYYDNFFAGLETMTDMETYINVILRSTTPDRISFDYQTPNVIKVTCKYRENITRIYTVSVPEQIANTADIPPIFLTTFSPLLREKTALYGRLFGKHYPYLPTHLTHETIDAEGNSYIHNTTYTYETDEKGMISTCTASYDNDVPTVYTYKFQ
jgi:hypothetical protein